MPQSCRDIILNVWKDDSVSIGTNAGLLRDRYLEFSVKDDKHKDARNRLWDAISDAIVQMSTIYKLAYEKNLTSVISPNEDGIFKTDGHMVIGLGSENVLETGLSLQHTYGTPLIPGSALKGLASHYCDHVWGASDPRFNVGADYHETIFGTSEDSGHIIFYDAWIAPESLVDSLKQDVMTPHHSDYYSKKDDTAPTDFDDPIPITFLSVVGSFHISVSCDVQNSDGERWTKLAFKILTEALREWGIGGKTNAGYGRLVLEGSGGEIKQLSDNVDSANKSPGLDETKPKSRPKPPVKKTKHIKGEIVDVIRVPDPNERRDKPYFVADDGVGGQVTSGTPPSVGIGQKARLEIKGVMEKEGLYDFAAVGVKKEPSRQARDKRGKR